MVAILPGGGDKAKSFKAAEDVLQSHPDLNGIFAINDPSALGAVAAVEKAGRSRQVQQGSAIAVPPLWHPRIAIVPYYLYTMVEKFPVSVMPSHRNVPPPPTGAGLA